MIHGISGAPIPTHLPYSKQIQSACESFDWWPCVLYSIGWRESISGEGGEFPNACTVISFDHGYGIFQITYPFTSPWPPANWQDAETNAKYALQYYLKSGTDFFVECGLSGDALIKCIAAGFNCGNEIAWQNHLAGDVDSGTTGHNYGAAVLANYHRLINGQDPI